MQAEPPFSVNLPSNVDFEECAHNIIPINDDNYRAVVDWFKACLLLSDNLPNANKDDYELKVIANVKNSLSDFFQRTELSLSTLVELEREVSAMFRSLGAFKSKSSDSFDNYEDCEPCDSSDSDLDGALDQLYKRLLWVAIASVILLILLILVLATLCWFRKYIEREMKEIFVACPSKEMRDLGSKDTAKSGHSTHSKRRESRKTSAGGSHLDDSPSPEGYELPEYEDEQYLKDYGGPGFRGSTSAYPVKVRMAPFERKRQSGNTGRCILKKPGANEKTDGNKK